MIDKEIITKIMEDKKIKESKSTEKFGINCISKDTIHTYIYTYVPIPN